MALQKFKSKVDRWIQLMLITAIVADIVVLVMIALRPGEPLATTMTMLLCIASVVLIGSLMLGTYYTVDKGVLRVVCGPFRWRIAIKDIISVTPSRNPLSSPALSLDRLLIRYGKGRRILVSPDDKRAFLRAVGHDEE